MKNSLKIKSSVFLAVLLIATVFLLGFWILTEIKQYQEEKQQQFLLEQSNIANMYVRQALFLYEHGNKSNETKEVPALFRKRAEITTQLEMITGMQVVLFIANDAEGKMMENPAFTPSKSADKTLLQHAQQNQVAYHELGETLYYIAPLGVSGDAIGFKYSMQKDQDFYHKIQQLFLQIGSTVVVMSFILAYVYFYRITNGILRLKESTEQIRQGNYQAIVSLNRTDELGKLSEGVAEMSQKIQENIQTMEEKQINLSLAVDKLKKLEKQQKIFIGNITHEFKTPLTVILAYMDLLEMYKEDSNLLEDARANTAKEAKRLYDLVEKVLQLASIEKYEFEFRPEKLASHELLQELCQRMNGKAKKYDVTITTDLQEAMLWMDDESFHLIFINLLDNAIKYNHQGGTICVKSEVRDEMVIIQIIDTGIGISDSDLEKVFESFYVVNKDRSKTSGGTGLGLPLVKQLIEKQKGTIRLQSIKEKGTEVQLIFPVYQEGDK
jgi:signal transduction histidine kinase